MKELGAEIGVAESTISQYETGKRQPDYETLLKLSEYFGVSVDCLLGRDTKERIPAAGEDRFSEGEIIRLDADSIEILKSIRERPDLKIMFSVSKNVTADDLKKAIKIVEALKEDGEPRGE